MTVHGNTMAWPELVAALRADHDPALWRTAADRLRREPDAAAEFATRTVRLAVLSTCTQDFLCGFLPVAGLAVGLDLRVHQAPFGTVEQELLRPSTALREHRPEYVLLSGTSDDLELCAPSSPDDKVATAVKRWSVCWEHARQSLGCRVVQQLFVPPGDDAWGQLSNRLPDGPETVVGRINAGLLDNGHGEVLFLDAARLAATFGRRAWSDPRLWTTLRQPVSFDALPALAGAIAGLLAADLGSPAAAWSSTWTTRCGVAYWARRASTASRSARAGTARTSPGSRTTCSACAAAASFWRSRARTTRTW